jgi:hypothetical protein
MTMKYAFYLWVTAAILTTAGCTDSRTSGDTASVHSRTPARKWLEPVRTNLGITGRSVLKCPAGDCVVLHYPPQRYTTAEQARYLRQDPSRPNSEAHLYHDPDNRWCQTDALYPVNNTFNCCAYAVGDAVGLTVDDWIAGEATADTRFINPMQVLLDSYYKRVKVYDQPGPSLGRIANDRELRDEDVLCFVDTRGSHGPVFNHAGRICKRNGINWLVSKYGSGLLVCATIRTVAREYADSFDQVWIYRQKKPT